MKKATIILLALVMTLCLATPVMAGWFDDASKWTEGAVEDASKWTEGAVEDASDWTEGAVEDVSDWTEGAVEDVSDWTEGAVEDASNWTKGAVEDTSNQAGVRVYVDGQKVQFDQQPYVDMEAKRTLVPFRQIFEALGAEVWYDGNTNSAMGQKEGLTIQLPIDHAKALVNNREITLDVASKIVNGRTMVPLRFISESMGCTVTPEGDLANLSIYIESSFSVESDGEDISESKRIFNKDGKLMYEGYLKDGLYHGYGTYYWNDGTTYEGQWDNGKRNGEGTIYYPKGNIKYTGQWKNDLKHGQGTYFFESGDQYEGEWYNDMRYGQGVYYYASGDKYEGQWVEDKMHGYGTFYWADGRKFEGRFENGKIIRN